MPALDDWMAEIERITGGLVVLVPVETRREENALVIPPAFPGRPMVRDLFLREDFVRQFVRAHALSVDYTGGAGTFHFILLNMARATAWEAYRDSLIAHELGHLWLNATGYRSPDQDPQAPSCQAIHIGDIVQHVLIRSEMRRRGFDLGLWTANLREWLANMTPEADLDPCTRAQTVSLWVDALLGGGAADPQEQAGRVYPSLAPVAAEIAGFLGPLDLWDRSMYEAALHFTAARLS